MGQTSLTVFGPFGAQELTPDPKGTMFGRSSRCQMVLECKDVSREHARLSIDPFGRWIVEDLGSSNGTFLNGKRVDCCPVSPGEPISIGSFSIILREPPEVEAAVAGPDETRANIIMEDFETEFLYDRRTDFDAGGSADRVADVCRRVEGISSASAFCRELCRSLAAAPKSVAAVVRLPQGGEAIPKALHNNKLLILMGGSHGVGRIS